jgi:hypothetical protein
MVYKITIIVSHVNYFLDGMIIYIIIYIMYTFNNQVSAVPLYSNVGYDNSWLRVSNNAGRELFAQANYITNFDDLSISLSTSDINIGNVHIADSTNGLHADVVSVGIGSGALRVISQDLESTEDDVTIGDRLGNFAAIYQELSALKVYVTNPNMVHAPYSYTLCETRTTGNPSFTPKQILINNLSDNNVSVILTLTSGLTCSIPIGKNNSLNHSVSLNLAVSAVNNYNDCSINFFA